MSGANDFTMSLAAKLQPESQKLLRRNWATPRDRDFTGKSGDGEYGQGENAFFGALARLGPATPR
jgi:hypothetical protein